MNNKLPPLPKALALAPYRGSYQPLYTEDQMTEYAQAAWQAAQSQPQAEMVNPGLKFSDAGQQTAYDTGYQHGRDSAPPLPQAAPVPETQAPARLPLDDAAIGKLKADWLNSSEIHDEFEAGIRYAERAHSIHPATPTSTTKD